MKYIRWTLIFFFFCGFFIFSGPLFQAKNLSVQEKSFSANQRQQLLDSEKNFPLKLDNEKKIQWASEKKDTTEYALVFLHGFSASRKELSPLLENLANEMHANVFFARITAHGFIDSEDIFSNLKAQDFVADAEEAFAVAKTLGKKIILVGNSTGAAMATYLAHKYSKQIFCSIFLSANYEPANPFAKLATGPFAKIPTQFFAGKTREWTPKFAEQKKYWSTKYNTNGIIAMMEFLKFINSLEFKQIQSPALFVYTDKDEVVNLNKIRKVYDEIGSPLKKIINFSDANDHIMAGDIMNPQLTTKLQNIILEFIRSVR